MMAGSMPGLQYLLLYEEVGVHMGVGMRHPSSQVHATGWSAWDLFCILLS
jgi:hypothetical protein